jgi:retron-type reverse transcriptase
MAKMSDRQLQIEGFEQKVGAEPQRYAQVSLRPKTPENNTNRVNVSLLEEILAPDNMNKAYGKVKANKGAGGIDKMGVGELGNYLKDHKVELLDKRERGKYKPNPVRRVEIPKEEKGKIRQLGIPTVVDRVIQQAIALRIWIALHIKTPLITAPIPERS